MCTSNTAGAITRGTVKMIKEQQSLVGTATVKMTENDLDAVISGAVVEFMSRPIPAEEIATVPGKSGAYAILCDKPAPYGKDLPMTKDGLYILYNGAAKNLSNRLRRHLHKQESGKWSADSGLAYNTMTEAKFSALIASGDIDEYLSVYFKKGADDNGNQIRFLNGINVKSPQFKDFQFYIAYVVTDNYANAVERVFRTIYGQPPLCRTTFKNGDK